MTSASQIAQLSYAVREQMAEIDRLRAERDGLIAERDQLRTRLDGFTAAFEADGSLGILQLMSRDMTLPPEIRVRAASAAVQYERAKPPSTSTTVSVSLFQLLEEKRRAKGAGAKIIEHHDPQPAA